MGYEDYTEEDLDKDLMDLLQKGLISVEYDEELNATFSVTQMGVDYVKNLGRNHE
jgi:hypothetical protein